MAADRDNAFTVKLIGLPAGFSCIEDYCVEVDEESGEVRETQVFSTDQVFEEAVKSLIEGALKNQVQHVN